MQIRNRSHNSQICDPPTNKALRSFGDFVVYQLSLTAVAYMLTAAQAVLDNGKTILENWGKKIYREFMTTSADNGLRTWS